MLFSELYGCYFHTVSAVLAEAVQHTLTGERLRALVQRHAFAESGLTIPAALQTRWPLLKPDLSTPLRRAPSLPLTLLEQRWLKTLLQDPRIALFAPDPTGLEDVEPLFDLSDVVYFDRYLDGDPYTDPAYIAVFRRLLCAVQTHRRVQLLRTVRSGAVRSAECLPLRLEYSAKDDKFRLLTAGNRSCRTVNLANIRSCRLLEPVDPSCLREPARRLRTLTFRLTDERNALERALLHFSHFEKQTVRLDGRHYEVTLRYEKEDETELLIRVLSFGPMLRVTAPEDFVALVRTRLQRQLQLTAVPSPPREPPE